MGPSGRIGYILHILDYLGQVSCRCFIWVELSVQRRLCPIFVRNVGSIDIHECFRGLTGSQRTPGFGASQRCSPSGQSSASLTLVFSTRGLAMTVATAGTE